MSIKRQFLWSMAPLLATTAVNIFSVRLFYRYLGPDLYALWFYVITFTGMFGFADLGLGVAVGRYIGVALGRGDDQAVREYWGTGNLIAIPLIGLIALIFIGLGVCFGPKWYNVAPGNENLLRWCFVAGGLGLFCGYYGQFWIVLLQAHLEFKFSNILKVAAGLLQVVPSLGLAYLTGSPLVLCLWTLLVGVAQMAVSIGYSRRHFKLGLNLGAASRARAREMASYTGKTFANLLFASVFWSLDRLILGRLAAPAAFAHYTIASNAGGRIQSLAVAIMGPVFHNTSRTVGGKGTATAADVYNQTFEFTFGWYLLLAIWATLWHPVLLRLWLGKELGAAVAPVFPPLVIAACVTGVSMISGAQLGPLNRVGTGLMFNIFTSILVAIGTYLGWVLGGVTGVAYGWLFSRLSLVTQDLFIIRLIGAGGWLAKRTWLEIAAQCLVGACFAATYLVIPRHSLWLIVPATVHGGIVSAWLLRHYLRNFLAAKAVPRSQPPAPMAPVPKL